MMIRQTAPSGHRIAYEIPDDVALAVVLAGWNHVGGVRSVAIETERGTWTFERAEDAVH